MKRLVILVSVAFLFVGCGTGSERAASPPSPTAAPTSSPDLGGAPSGALVFLSLGNLAASIYAVNADGSDLAQLTDSISIDSNPQWSPDGTRIAFSSADRGNEPGTDVYVMDADGKNERKLTNSENGNWHYFDSWSPDGRHILYDTSTIAAGDMWVADADGGNATRIAETVSCSVPDWSPDGNRLVGCQCEQGERTGCSLFLVNADGSGLITLIESSAEILAPRWSPDGSRLLYTDGLNQPSVGVYVVDLPDGKPRKVYEGPIAPLYEDVISPIWSPDGRDIAIATGTQLLLVSADSGESRLAVDDGALYVAFSPDGSRVAYTAKRGDDMHLFVAGLDGGSPIEVASGPMGWGVDWSPDGSRIVFSSSEKHRNGTYWVSSDGSERGMIAPFTPGAGKTPEPPPSLIGGCDQRDEQGVAQPGKGCASPDGRLIVFSGVLIESGRAPTTSLVVIDSAAGTQTDITPEGVQPEQGRPAWSPDGGSIAFRGSDDDGCWLYTIAPDGSGLKRVVSLRGPTTCSCEADVSVLWSPDGQYLYYTKGAISWEGCAPGFPYRVGSDGTDERQLADVRSGGLYGFVP